MLRKFSKSVLIYGLSPTFSKFVGVFLIPIYTRVFCPEEYGVIDLFYTLVLLFTVFIDLQIYSGVGRYFYDTEDKKSLVSTALWNVVLLSMIFVSLVSIFSKNINQYFLGSLEYYNIFLLALLWTPVNVIGAYLTVIMRYENKPWSFLLISVFQTLIKVTVSLITILVFKYGVAGIFLGHIAGDLTVVFLYSINLKKYLTLRYNFKMLKMMLMFSVPLVPAVLAFYLNQSFIRFVMLKYLSLDAIGIFSVALKFASILGMISMAIKMAWEPFMYENLKRNDHKIQFIRIYKMINMFLFLLIFGIILFSEEILIIMTSEKYYAGASIVGLLAISFLFQILAQFVEIGTKIVHKTIYNSFASITGMVVNIISLFFLVPFFEIVGAALALCAGFGINLIICWYYTEKFYPIGYPKLLTFIIILLLFLSTFIVNMFPVFWGTKIAVVVIFLMINLWCYRDVLNRKILIPLFNYS